MAEEILAPIFDPFDRTTEHFRGGGNAGVFRIDSAFRAEAAADIGRDDVHLVIVEVENVEQSAFDPVRPLRGDVDGVGVRDRIIGGDKATAFQEEGAAAMDDEPLPYDMCGRREGDVGIADRYRNSRGNVRLRPRMGNRRAGQDRRGTIDDRRQRLVVDLDLRSRIFRKRPAFGDDDRDRLARIDGFASGKRIGQVELFDRGARNE